MIETRKLQLHFPLDRLPEPIYTRLAKDFSIEPNLLRADVDANKGGWMIVEVKGDSAKIDVAQEWLEKQGILIKNHNDTA